MAQKCSDRRVILQRMQNLMNELVATNESALRIARDSEATDLSDVADKINAILDGSGLATTTDGTGNTVSDTLVGMLYGNVADDVKGALDWTYLAE